MRTVTFYSYKGGTGRTLLLANVAVLAARMGWKVVAIDVDLEAPGLTYKLLDDQPTRCDGLVGWLRNRFETGNPPLSLGDSLIDVELIDPFDIGGWLKLMPAGRHPSLNYFQDLIGLRLEQRINEGPGVDAFIDLQRQVLEELEPDLLLLDARTGISSTNLVTTRVLADDVIALTLDTREQLDGTRSVLRSLTPLVSLRTDEPLELHVVLSRVAPRPAEIGSYAWTSAERLQVEHVRTFLREPADPLRATLTLDRVHLVHSEPSLVRGEFLTLARTRVLDATALHVDCLRVAEAVLGETVNSFAAKIIRESVDPERRELVARFFAQREEIMIASGEVIARRLANGDRALLGREESRTSPAVEQDTSRRDDRERLRTLAARARALSRLAGYFIESARYEDAADAAERAAAQYDELAGSDPTFRGALAASLMQLGIGYARVGRREDAIAPAERAVEIYSQLTPSKPKLRGDLATALGNLADLWSFAGEHDRALGASRHAIVLHRSIAEQVPAIGKPLLAASLRELAGQLSAAGKHSDAHGAAAESERLYAELLDAG